MGEVEVVYDDPEFAAKAKKAEKKPKKDKEVKTSADKKKHTED